MRIFSLLSIILLTTACSVFKGSHSSTPIAPYSSQTELTKEKAQAVGNIVRFHLVTRKQNSDTVIDTKATFISPMEHQIQESYGATDIKKVLPYIQEPGTYIFSAPVPLVFKQEAERPPLLSEQDTVEYVFTILSLETPSTYKQREQSEQAELYQIQKQNIFQYFSKQQLDTTLIQEPAKGVFVLDRNIQSKSYQDSTLPIQDQDSIAVHYNGYLLDGRMFDSSYKRNEPFSFKINAEQVIPAWDLGILGLEIGKRYYLACTSSLAYGKYGTGGQIGPNEVLIFQIEVIKRY